MSEFEYRVWKKVSPNPTSNSWRHQILIDGQIISSHCIDLEKVVASFEEPGEYFLLTCSCGEPGCAGLFEPFQVAHLGDGIIYWHILQPEPEREFYFSARQAIDSLIKGLRIRKAHEDPRWGIDVGVLERLERLQCKLLGTAFKQPDQAIIPAAGHQPLPPPADLPPS